MTEGDEPARHPRAHRADRSDRRAQASRRPRGAPSPGFLTALNDGHRARLLARGPGRPAPARAGHRRRAGPGRRPGQVGVAEQPPGSNDGPQIAAVPHRHGGQRRRAVVRLLHLLGRGAGRRPARRGRAGLRLGQRALRLGASAPAAPPRPAPACAQPGRPHRLGRPPHRHRRVRRPRRLDPHHRGQLLQRRLAAHATGPTAAAPRATCGSAESRRTVARAPLWR